METLSRSRRAFVLILTLVLIPSAALAQATLSGVVKDDWGAFLPGVMVEAHSSVLQREARTVSDSKGEFTLSNLPSGRYKVTFTLSGFDIPSLDGVELREATIGVTAVAAIDHGGCAAFRSTGRCLTNREVAVDVPPPFRPLWVGEIRDLEALQAGYPCDRISLSQGGGLSVPSRPYVLCRSFQGWACRTDGEAGARQGHSLCWTRRILGLREALLSRSAVGH